MKRRMALVSVWLVLALALVALVPLAVSADSWYMVQPGDTLYSIGRRFGVNAYSIAAANGLANPDLIWPGQHLRIPAGGFGHPMQAAPRQQAPAMQHVAQGGMQPVQQLPQGGMGGQWVWVSHTQYGPGPANWGPLQQQRVWIPYNAALQPIVSRLWGGEHQEQDGFGQGEQHQQFQAPGFGQGDHH